MLKGNERVRQVKIWGKEKCPTEVPASAKALRNESSVAQGTERMSVEQDCSG